MSTKIFYAWHIGKPQSIYDLTILARCVYGIQQETRAVDIAEDVVSSLLPWLRSALEFFGDDAADEFAALVGGAVYPVLQRNSWRAIHRFCNGSVKQYRLKDFRWYPVIADLSIPFEQLCDALDKHLRENVSEYRPYMSEIRGVGIDIACYDEDNAALPYPIKITRKMRGVHYEDLPASKTDPEQGMVIYHAKRWR